MLDDSFAGDPYWGADVSDPWMRDAPPRARSTGRAPDRAPAILVEHLGLGGRAPPTPGAAS